MTTKRTFVAALAAVLLSLGGPALAQYNSVAGQNAAPPVTVDREVRAPDGSVRHEKVAQPAPTDRYGNAIKGIVVAWASTSGALSAASDTTDSTGIASSTLTVGSATGQYTATATAPGLSPTPFTITVVNALFSLGDWTTGLPQVLQLAPLQLSPRSSGVEGTGPRR